MRHTSYRRRSGMKVLGSLTEAGYGLPSGPAVPRVGNLVVPEDTPGSVTCEVCGANVKSLSRGQPRAHAPGGYSSSVKRGLYACEGSGTLAGL